MGYEVQKEMKELSFLLQKKKKKSHSAASKSLADNEITGADANEKAGGGGRHKWQVDLLS